MTRISWYRPWPANTRRAGSIEQREELLPRDPAGLARLAEGDLRDASLALLQREDSLLDRVLGHHAIHHDGALLSEAMRAVCGLFLHGRVPPWIEQEDVVGRREVEARAAGLERHQEHGRAALVLELAHHRAPIAGRAVEAREADARRPEMRLDAVEQRGPLGEHERLVAFGDRVLERLDQALDLRRRLGVLPGDEARVAGGLAQAQQRLERGEHASAARLREFFGHALAGRDAHGVVDAALRLVELDVKHGVRAGRQLAQDLALGAAQHERTDLRAQTRGRFGVTARDGVRVTLLEVADAPEQARVREVHRAPELLEPVLHGRAAQDDTKLPPQLVSRASRLAVDVLDGLALVEHDDVPVLLRDQLGVEAKHGVRHESDLGGGVDPTLRSLVDRRTQTGAEAVDLVDPVVDDALRAHDEHAAAKDADRLQRLAEAHVVGQHGAELRVAQERKPVHTLLLIWAEIRVEALGTRRARDALELAEERGESCELRGTGRLERVAERPERQQRGRAELLVRAARGQQ